MSKHEEFQAELQHIAQLRAVELQAIYQKYAEMTAPFIYTVAKQVFEKFPDLATIKMEMAPQYNDEGYCYGFGDWGFTPTNESEHADSDEDWETWHDDVSEYLSDLIGGSSASEKLLQQTMGNANIKITREGIEVSALGDDSRWTEDYY